MKTQNWTPETADNAQITEYKQSFLNSPKIKQFDHTDGSVRLCLREKYGQLNQGGTSMVLYM